MATPAAARARGERFLTNVLWSWTGVAAGVAQGIVLTPFILHRLGEEHYGMWLQIFSILDYLWFFDLGLNTAVSNFCARFLALNEHYKINQVICTALFYFTIIGAAVWAIAPALAANAHRFFRIAPADRREFAALILMTVLSWGMCIMAHLFVSALDGFQRFDLTSRIMALQVLLRTAGYFAALQLGYGLVAMAGVYIATQILGYAMNFVNFRRIFPEIRISPRYVSRAVFRDIFRYGVRSFVANSSTLALNQSGAVMVGHYLGEAAVGFYALPNRLLQQAVDAVSRIGIVTRSSAAELSATARREQTIGLAIYSNRYSLALFMPLAVFLAIYGQALILRWIGPSMAMHAAPLLPVFLLSNTLVIAGQFNSGSLLYGVGRHGGYARGLVIEAALYITALVWAVPKYGLWGAAWASAALMIGIRGVYTPWLVARALEYSFLSYMRGIYVRPLAAAVPAAIAALALKMIWLPGHTWPQLIAAGCLSSAVYASFAIFICIKPDHRSLLVGRIPIIGPRLMPSRA